MHTAQVTGCVLFLFGIFCGLLLVAFADVLRRRAFRRSSAIALFCGACVLGIFLWVVGSNFHPPDGVSHRAPYGCPAERRAFEPNQDRVFVTSGGSRFEPTGELTWSESRINSYSSSFAETSRTETYIELHDRDRQIAVRLFADHGEWAGADTAQWHPWPAADGCWIKK